MKKLFFIVVLLMAVETIVHAKTWSDWWKEITQHVSKNKGRYITGAAAAALGTAAFLNRDRLGSYGKVRQNFDSKNEEILQNKADLRGLDQYYEEKLRTEALKKVEKGPNLPLKERLSKNVESFFKRAEQGRQIGKERARNLKYHVQEHVLPEIKNRADNLVHGKIIEPLVIRPIDYALSLDMPMPQDPNMPRFQTTKEWTKDKLLKRAQKRRASARDRVAIRRKNSLTKE